MFLVKWCSSDGWEQSDGLLFSSLDKDEAINFAEDFSSSRSFIYDDRMSISIIGCKGTEFNTLIEWPRLSNLEFSFHKNVEKRYTHVLYHIYSSFQVTIHKLANDLYVGPENSFFLRINGNGLPELYITKSDERISLLQSSQQFQAIMKTYLNVDPCMYELGEYDLFCECLNCKENRDDTQ